MTFSPDVLGTRLKNARFQTHHRLHAHMTPHDPPSAPSDYPLAACSPAWFARKANVATVPHSSAHCRENGGRKKNPILQCPASGFFFWAFLIYFFYHSSVPKNALEPWGSHWGREYNHTKLTRSLSGDQIACATTIWMECTPAWFQQCLAEPRPRPKDTNNTQTQRNEP